MGQCCALIREKLQLFCEHDFLSIDLFCDLAFFFCHKWHLFCDLASFFSFLLDLLQQKAISSATNNSKMETLERLERVDRELTEKWRFISVELDIKDAKNSKLTYTSEEEESLEESFNDAINAYEKALQDADEYVAELNDPVEIAETKRSVKFFRDQSKRLVVNVRKVSGTIWCVCESRACIER